MSEQDAVPAAASRASAPPARGGATGADYLPTLLGLVGFALGLLIVLYGNEANDNTRRFAASPEFWMWAALIAGQTALWLALAVPLYRSLREFKVGRAVVVKGALFVAGGLLLSYLGVGRPRDTQFAHHAVKMGIINTLGAAVVLLALSGIWLSQAALKALLQKIERPGGGPSAPGLVGEFLKLRGHLERSLLAAGVFVGAATLANGGLRNATLAHAANANFPYEYVLMYGLLASGLLALIYAPAHAQLVAARARLRDALVPLPDGRPESWSAWNSERRAVEDLLGAHSGVIASFTGGVSILTPLVGSLLAILLGGDN